MIGQRELEKRASALGLAVRHVELDYVLNHLLAAIAEDPGGLIFRGGTALARVYWPDFRISEDLDFISPGAAPGLERTLSRSTGLAADSTGLALELEFGRPRGDRSRSLVRWSTPWETSGELLIDVVSSERAALQVQKRALVLPYSDLPKTAVIPVMDIAEILGNKWLMLDDRDEPRDLFDLWWALAREAIPFATIAAGHRAKYGYAPMPASIEQARKLGRAWQQRLAYQVVDLPTFDEAIAVVETAFREWGATA